ncbi:uncharacterized protein LOC144630436 [Oculina patagonica]
MMSLRWILRFFLAISVGGCFILPIKGTPVPIGFYPLDGISGLNDTSSCKNVPGISNDTTLGPGYVGEPNTAYRFRGTPSSYVRLPNSGMFNTTSITLLAWFNTGTSTGQQTILQFSSEGRLAILLSLNSDKLNVIIYPNCYNLPISVSPLDITFKTSTWYFIGASYDYALGYVKIRVRYTDGSQIDRTFHRSVIELETYHDIWLGYGPESPGAFNGSIACVQVYNQSLTKTETSEVQKLCLPRQWSEPFALYPLNEIGIAQDMSGNSNPNGTPHNVNEAEGPFSGEKSIDFDGKATSYIRINHNGELSMNASFSIVAWIYKNPLTGTEGDIVTFTSDNHEISGLIFYGTWSTSKALGKLHFPSSGHNEEVGNVYGNYFSTGLWHHIALIYNYDTGYASLYTNEYSYGKSVGSNVVDTSGEVTIGKSFYGRIACVQFYRRPLLLGHVEDAKDMCYRGSPDPPVCSPPSHVTALPCPSSSSVTSSLSTDSSISIGSTHPASLVSVRTTITELPSATLDNSMLLTETAFQTQKTISLSNTATIISPTSMSSTSSIDVEPTLANESSLLWTKVVSEPQKTTSISSADTVISSTLISGYSSTGIEPTVTVTSVLTSTVGSYKTSLPDSVIETSFTRASKNSATASSSPETSRPTPFVASTSSYLTSSTRDRRDSLVTSRDLKSTSSSPETCIHTPLVRGTSYLTSCTQADSHVTGSDTKAVAPSQPLTNTAASSTVIKGNEKPANWTQWSAWSSCSKPCGTGQQSRIRHCNKTGIEDCIGNGTETRQCNVCEVAVFNFTATLVEWQWNDSLSLKNSSSFIALEDTLRQEIRELYSSDSVNVKLLSCRRGSVIVDFSVEFEAVDSHQVVKLADSMENEGLLSALGPVVLVNITADKVPNQTPTTVKAYLTSSTSLRVVWTAVVEPIDGYHLAYRSTSAVEWTNVYTTAQTLSLDLENLNNGDVYRVRVAAFNAAGNGIPSEGTEVHLKEGVPRAAPVVSVSDSKNISTLMISWTAIPAEHVMGNLLGYHVMYKAIKRADRYVVDAEPVTVTMPASGPHELILESLSQFTQYRITVAGYTAAGLGKASKVLGETCVCPKHLYTNWALYPPYVTENNQQPAGIIGELVQEMILSSCGKCTGHGETILDFTQNGKGAAARKTSMGEVGSDVDDKTQVSFPIIGHIDDDKFLKEFVFVPVVESPGIAFISLANEPSRTDVAALAWSKSWAIVVLSVVMGFIAAVLIWLTERGEKAEKFPRSFLQGTGDLTWFAVITMTTVGFGEKTPVKVASRLITIIWIIIGLVLMSIFLAVLTVSLTVMATDDQLILYGTKVTALRDSPSHRLGIRRNAKVEHKETLEEAFDALQNGETEGFLLDAYVAGSGVSNFIKTPFRVNKVIETNKGLGVVLSGEAIVLRHRVRDFVRKNAGKITEIIQNSTSPLEQPEQSEAEENAQGLVDANSPTYQDAIAVVAGALGVSFLIGMAWELFRKRHRNRAKGQSEELYKSKKAEIEEIVEDFYSNFTQAYSRLRKKHKRQFRMYQALAKQRGERRSKNSGDVLSKKPFEQSHTAVLY